MNGSFISRILNLSKKGEMQEIPEIKRNNFNSIPFKSFQSTFDNELFNNLSLSIYIFKKDNQTIDYSSITNATNPKNKQINGKSNLESTPKKKNLIYTKKVGFENLGNTCYLNTSLNCLIHSKKFTKEFMNSFNNNLDSISISYELYKLINEIVIMDNKDTYKPKKLLTAFCDKHKKFKGFVQHDAQEFLRILLEDISNELNRVKTVPTYKELQLKNKSKVVANKAFHELFLERENSIIVDLFYGQICNIFACESCNYKTYSFEKIMDIPILLGNIMYVKLEEVKNYDLMELLNLHFKDDVFQWDKKCESRTCNFRGNHIKSSRITILPKILIITFQRYNYRSKKKNTSKIVFEPTIDIAKFVDLDCVGLHNSTKYNLYAISNHTGTLDFGHYYAYCRIENSWYEFNDSYVTNIGEIKYENRTVYALFYELDEDN